MQILPASLLKFEGLPADIGSEVVFRIAFPVILGMLKSAPPEARKDLVTGFVMAAFSLGYQEGGLALSKELAELAVAANESATLNPDLPL